MIERHVGASTLFLVAAIFAQPSASAQRLARPVQPLSFVPIEEGAVRVDGSLREYRDLAMARVGSSSTSSMRYALGYDANGIYVAASIKDERLVRSRRGGSNDDAVVLTIASPTGRGLVVSEVWLHPGVPGRRAGVVLVGAPGRRARAARGARIVEAGREGGYDLEAFVPFSAIPGAADWQRGRGAIRFSDVDRETGRAAPSVHASAPAANPGRMPPIVGTGAELGSFSAFLRDRGIDRARVQFDLRGDIAGDARPERVVIAGAHAAAMGAGYRDGASYDFTGLGDLAGAGVIAAELRDLTGDGKSELLVTTEARGPEGLRRVASVYSFARGRIELVWGAVIGIRSRLGKIDGRLEIERSRRGAPSIIVHAGRSEGLDASNCRTSEEGDEEPPLVPWGPIAARVYRFDGTSFELIEEKRNRRYSASTEPRPARTRARASSRRPAARAPAAAAPSLEQLLAAARRERGIPASVRPTFELRANVAEDRRPEQLVVLGGVLVVVGPGFRGGRGYFHFELPVSAPEDLLEVTTRDVTGDGREEIFVRIRQRLGQGFERDVLLLHRFTRAGFPRVLAVEIARTDGTRRIENRVRPTGRGSTAALVIEPGRVVGWSRTTWPFAGFANDGVGPLLLPWQDSPKRYRLERGELVAR